MNMDAILWYFITKYKGNWESVYQALSEKEQIKKEHIEKLYAKSKDKYISAIDKNYPDNFTKIYKPPFVVFHIGNLKHLYDDKKVSLCINDFENFELNNFINDKEYYSDNTFVVKLSNEKLIVQLLINNKKIIAVSENGLEKASDSVLINELIAKNNLVISEIPQNFSNNYNEQYEDRLIVGLTRNVFISSKNNNKQIKSLCELENIECKNISNFNKAWNFSNKSDNDNLTSNEENKRSKK